MQFRIIAPAAGLPVSIRDLKDHLRLGTEDEDHLLIGYASAATNHLETITNRFFLSHTVEQVFPAFPHRYPLELRGRVSDVLSVNYRDPDFVLQTVDRSTYWLNSYCEPALLSLSVNKCWPATAESETAVEVTYISGYGNSPEDVPDALRQAVLLLTAHWYENRVPVSVGASVSALPFGIECLVSSYKIWTF